MNTEFSTHKAKEVLGDDMPELTPTPLGRHRLVNALANKFGKGWRNHPKAKGVIHDFDVQHQFHAKMRELKHEETKHRR